MLNYRLRFVLLLQVMLLPSMLYAQESSGMVESWLTTSSKRMEQQATKQIGSASTATVQLTLQVQTRYQTIDGFGWMLNQGSAKLLMQLSPTDRRALLQELFGAEGLNASMLRVAIGACDLSESDYTYCDQKDETLSSFAIASQDLSSVVPVLQEILVIKPDLKILATAWTAPTWMKTGAAWYNSFVDGTLKAEYYDLYADYFLKYIEAMAEWNIPIWGISVQNEPLNGHNDPSMTWTKETMYKFIAGSLGPKIKDSAYPNTRIIAYDHNCDVTDFPIYVAKSRYVYGTAFHLYAGDISALSTVYNSTGKPVLFTEQYISKDGDFWGDMTWHFRNVMLGTVLNSGTTALEWNLASDPSYSIHTAGGCTTCKGALTINGSAITERNTAYYIIGQMSKVVDAGAKRIAASGTAENLEYAVFSNPDGTYAFVGYSNNGTARSASLSFNDKNGTTCYAPFNLPSNGVIAVRVTPADATALYETSIKTACEKELSNGVLLIKRDGQTYDVLGRKR